MEEFQSSGSMLENIENWKSCGHLSGQAVKWANTASEH